MTKAEWTARVKSQHGAVTRWPNNVEPASNTGKLAARYGARHYVLAPLSVRLGDANDRGNDLGDILGGKVFTPLENAADSAGRLGAIGLLAKALGVPVWVLVVVLLIVAYSVLRNVGLAPKLGSA